MTERNESEGMMEMLGLKLDLCSTVTIHNLLLGVGQWGRKQTCSMVNEQVAQW